MRYLDINAISGAIGNDMCLALPGMHAFTGCGSTSAFVGKGKKAFDLIRTDTRMCRAMKDLETAFVPNDELVSACK